MYYAQSGSNYWVQAHGKGTPILFLHGFTGSSKTWDDFVSTWRNQYRLLTIDLPGHGNTKTDKPIGMEDFCDHLALILENFSIEKVHVIGYSMGGRVALSFAMMYPDKVASLVLESASPGLESPHEQLSRQVSDELLAKKIEEDGVHSFIDYWQDIPLFDSQKKLPQSVRENIREERLKQTTEGLTLSLRGMGTGRQPSWWGQLTNLTLPVLLVVGELDQKFVRIAKKMHKAFKYSQLEIVLNTGHAVHVEQAENFGTIVKAFVNAVQNDTK